MGWTVPSARRQAEGWHGALGSLQVHEVAWGCRAPARSRRSARHRWAPGRTPAPIGVESYAGDTKPARVEVLKSPFRPEADPLRLKPLNDQLGARGSRERTRSRPSR